MNQICFQIWAVGGETWQRFGNVYTRPQTTRRLFHHENTCRQLSPGSRSVASALSAEPSSGQARAGRRCEGCRLPSPGCGSWSPPAAGRRRTQELSGPNAASCQASRARPPRAMAWTGGAYWLWLRGVWWAEKPCTHVEPFIPVAQALWPTGGRPLAGCTAAPNTIAALLCWAESEMTPAPREPLPCFSNSGLPGNSPRTALPGGNVRDYSRTGGGKCWQCDVASWLCDALFHPDDAHCLCRQRKLRIGVMKLRIEVFHGIKLKQ